MQVFSGIGVLLASYILGAIPFGLIFVKWATGKDLRKVESGRTGGTNAMRAAGVSTGVVTAVFDLLKGMGSVYFARAIFPEVYWLHVLAPLLTILGHNYSIFLIEKNEKGRYILRGGAGGAPCLGGAIGLWPPSILIILPIGFAIWYFIGYASLTTMSVALIAIVIFSIRAADGFSPWTYVAYGILAEGLVMWALRPNVRRLINGTERIHGLRARKKTPAPVESGYK